jgi:hypothetical protein
MILEIQVKRDDGKTITTITLNARANYLWRCVPGQEIRDGGLIIRGISVSAMTDTEDRIIESIRCACGVDVPLHQLCKHFGVELQQHLLDTVTLWLPRKLGIV